MTKKVTIEGRGAIDKLELICQPGKITVIEGRNGAGKSTAIDEVTSLATGKKPDATTKDGCTRGMVDGFGVTLKVGKSTRRTGELELQSFDEKFGLWDIIDPPIKDPRAADARRIKAYLYMTKAEPDANRFRELLPPEEFDSVVQSESMERNDITAIAGAIKRDVERKARDYENQAEGLNDRARRVRESAEGVDVEQEHDETVLQNHLEDALIARNSLDSQKRQSVAFADSKRKVELALKGLAASGPSVAELKSELAVVQSDLETKQAEYSDACSKIDELKRQLEQAERERAAAAKECLAVTKEETRLLKQLDDCKQHATDMQKLQDELTEMESKSVTEPATEMFEQADQDLAAARKANEQGVLIRKAIQAIEESDRLKEQAKEREKQADKMRNAAAGVDDILTSILLEQTDKFRVRDGVLMAEHPKRGWIDFHSGFSRGEKSKVAVTALKPVLEKAILTIPQEIWEGLDPDAKNELAGLVEETGATVITAQASRGELRSTLYERTLF
jgi:DNA repair exonuclease SbcCD ATPase subunit